MNLTMIKRMKSFVESANGENQLDLKPNHFDDAERIYMNEKEIRTLFVSLFDMYWHVQ